MKKKNKKEKQVFIKNKKAEGGMSFDVLIKLLLGIVVLVGIFYFLFGNYIWDYVRNLPGNNYNDRDKPISNISKDDVILAKYYKVAVILDGKYLKLCTNGDCNQLRDTKLYLNGDDRQGDIYTDINWAFDKKVGSILNSKLVINQDIFNGKGIYSGVKDDLPSYSDLRNLDGSLYIAGTFYRDKEYQIREGEGIFGTVFSYVEKDNVSIGDKLRNLGNGNALIVTLEYSFGNLKSKSFQIERYGDSFKIFVNYLDEGGNEKSTLLDCYNGWGNELPLANIKDSLTETLKQNCGL